MARLLFAVLYLSFLPLSTEAADYCHAEDLVLDQTANWDFASGFAAELRLGTNRNGQLMPSLGRLRLGTNGKPFLWANFANGRPQEAGWEYNVYKLEITIGDPADPDHQVFSDDYSHDCTETGKAIDFGSQVSLPPLPIAAHADGSPRGIEPVRVRVWGWQ